MRKRLPKNSVGTKLVLVGACVMAALFLFVGCGGQGADDGVDLTPAGDASVQGGPEALILSENYAGYLVVHLDESLGARLDSTKALYSVDERNGDTISSLQAVIDAHPGVTLQRSVTIDADKLDKLRARLEAKSGMKLADFNSIYMIEAKDPDTALALYNELKVQPGVEKIYPTPKNSYPGIASVPTLTGLQGYLYPDSTNGGLNAQAAWAAGIRGENVQVVDMEGGWNYLHEDLSISQTNNVFMIECDLTSTDSSCPPAIAHGTSVLGIIASQDNGHGTTGFSPDAKVGLAGIPHPATVSGTLLNLLAGDSSNGGMDPGSVFLIEVGVAGALGTCTNSNQYGCVPTTAFPANYDAVKYAIAAGVTVVEGAANGSVNLDDPATYDPTEVNISANDVGSIIVGSSMGTNHQKRVDTNYGNRVNVYAWGDRVVTTGYPYTGSPYIWQDTGGVNPPNTEANAYYTNMFGGTSAAAAMIAGAAALVQSYAKQGLGHPATRYIMPLKMREILVNSGVPQQGGGGNIGKQPRIDVAMNLVDQFLATVHSQYPQLASDEQLTDAETIALRQLGVGIICGIKDTQNHIIVGANDPSCSDQELWPEGNYIAKTYDFDGDGRADLVKFENGTWSVDLSSKGSGGDNYGAWDLLLNFTPINGKWVWPYVEDMNSDGRADFVAYDKEHGTFNVALTDTELINKGVWHGWDWVLDYSSQWHDDLKMNPDESNYSRVAIGDYDGNGFNDIGIMCSDGDVRVDYSDGTESTLGHYEWIAQLIPDELLAQAPGWAYVITTADYNKAGSLQISFKVPDGLPDEGRMYMIPNDGTKFYPSMDWTANAPHVFGGNDVIPLAGTFVGGSPMLGLKDESGTWRINTVGSYSIFEAPPPATVYGGADCHPVVGDFDGDDNYLIDDRAVMCPDEWRIAYSSDKFASQEDAQGVRHILLTYDKNKYSLPGRTYSGGISYALTKQLIQKHQQMYPSTPPPILVDMVTETSIP